MHKVNFDTADKTFKALVYETATRYPKDALKFRSNFIKYLANNVLVKDRFPLYLNFLKLHRNDPEFNAEVFEADCGVGLFFILFTFLFLFFFSFNFLTLFLFIIIFIY